MKPTLEFILFSLCCCGNVEMLLDLINLFRLEVTKSGHRWLQVLNRMFPAESFSQNSMVWVVSSNTQMSSL